MKRDFSIILDGRTHGGRDNISSFINEKTVNWRDDYEIILILTHYDSCRDKQVIKWERLPASTVKVVTCLLAFGR